MNPRDLGISAQVNIRYILSARRHRNAIKFGMWIVSTKILTTALPNYHRLASEATLQN